MATRKELGWDYVRHVPDGELFALQMDENGDIYAVAGPLVHREATNERLAAGTFRAIPKDLAWAREQGINGGWSLVEDDPSAV